MSWVNPVFPIDTENSIGFIVQFFLGLAQLVGDSARSSNLVLDLKMWQISQCVLAKWKIMIPLKEIELAGLN